MHEDESRMQTMRKMVDTDVIDHPIACSACGTLNQPTVPTCVECGAGLEKEKNVFDPTVVPQPPSRVR